MTLLIFFVQTYSVDNIYYQQTYSVSEGGNLPTTRKVAIHDLLCKDATLNTVAPPAVHMVIVQSCDVFSNHNEFYFITRRHRF